MIDPGNMSRVLSDSITYSGDATYLRYKAMLAARNRAMAKAQAQRAAALGRSPAKAEAKSTGGTGSGTKKNSKDAESWADIAARTLASATSAASSIDAYMRSAYNAALTSVMPDWQAALFGSSSKVIGNMAQLADSFKKNVLPKAMAQADAMSSQALSVVNSMLRGVLPDDVAAQLQRHAAEISNQIGVRGQAAQYLTARDLGLNSLQMIEKGLTYAPGAATLASSAYAGFRNVLGAPMNAITATGQMLNQLTPPTVDAGSLFANMLKDATSQSQFGTSTAGQNYWNRINYKAQQRAVGVAQDQLAATRQYQQQMYTLQQQQMQWNAAIALANANRGTTDTVVTTGSSANRGTTDTVVTTGSSTKPVDFGSLTSTHEYMHAADAAR